MTATVNRAEPKPTAECQCICQDALVDRLRDLIARGVGQWEASRLVFGEAGEVDAFGAWACCALAIVLLLGAAVVGGAR